MTAHTKTVTEKEIDAGNILGPSASKAVLQLILADPNFVAMIHKSGGQRKIICDENPKYIAKNRVQGMPQVMLETDFIKAVLAWQDKKRESDT